MTDHEDHDPIRVWHAQRERANMLLQLCEAVRKRELHPTVALAALGVAGVDGVLAGVAIEASLAPMVGAEGGAGCPAVNQTEPGPVVGGSPARASLDGWSIAPDPNSGTCEVRAPNGSVWTLGQHRAYGDDESEAST